MKICTSLLVVFAVAAAAFAEDGTHKKQEDAIREVVFRYQFGHNTSKLQKRAKAYYLTVGEKIWDPSDEFMNRFAGHTPPVCKVSECSYGDTVVGRRTGKPGLLFRIMSMRWVSDTEVRVAGGCTEAPGIGSCNTYTLKKESDGWKVTVDKSEDPKTWMPYGPGKP